MHKCTKQDTEFDKRQSNYADRIATRQAYNLWASIMKINHVYLMEIKGEPKIIFKSQWSGNAKLK